jgi:hypothetical protein
MWGYVESIRNDKAYILIHSGFGDRVDDAGHLEIPLFYFKYGSPPLRGLRVDDYLEFSPTRGFSRYSGNIVYDLDADVPERYQRCTLCKRTLRGKRYWSLFFGKESSNAYHRKCLKRAKQPNARHHRAAERPHGELLGLRSAAPVHVVVRRLSAFIYFIFLKSQ